VVESPGGPARSVTPVSLGDALAPALDGTGKRVAIEVLSRGVHVCQLGTPTASCALVEALGKTSFRPAWRGDELVATRFVTSPLGEDADLDLTFGGQRKRAPLVVQTGNQDFASVAPDAATVLYSSSLTVAVGKGGPRVVQTLWLADIPTHSARLLLAGDRQDIHPAWAPDDRRIAFASNRSGQFEIWTVKDDGTNLRQLTHGPGAKTWPTWSPDGRSLLYADLREGRQRLWMVSDDGTDLGEFRPFDNESRVELRDPEWR